MIHHTKAVKRGAKDTFIITDMPFLTYHLSVRDTVINAGRLIQEAGDHAVKLEDAKKCEVAVAFALLLECVPRQLAEEVTKSLSIPVIGIGAGLDMAALVLVYNDILDYGVKRVPKFVKQYHSLNPLILESIQAFAADVKKNILLQLRKRN